MATLDCATVSLTPQGIALIVITIVVIIAFVLFVVFFGMEKVEAPSEEDMSKLERRRQKERADIKRFMTYMDIYIRK